MNNMTETKEQQKCPYCHEPFQQFEMYGTGHDKFFQKKNEFGVWNLWRVTGKKALFCSRRESCVKCGRKLAEDEA